MTSVKHIRKDEPILAFGPIKDVPNPHSIAWVRSINYQTNQITCECQNGGGTFLLQFVNGKEDKLPFTENQYVLIQRKHNPSGQDIIKIKDAHIENCWKDEESYTPAFPEAIHVSVLEEVGEEA